MTEREKMLSGKIYDPAEKELAEKRKTAHKLCNAYNKLDEDDDKRKEILDKLLPKHNGAYLQGPIFFDYGENISFGKLCFANFNFTVLDCCPINIGDNVFFGPNVCLAAPIHPFLPSERNMYVGDNGEYTDREYAKPITIESNCWIASNVVICGGVTVGEGSIIGAGSVVTKDIPKGVLAAGNPARVIRPLTENDSVFLKKNLF